LSSRWVPGQVTGLAVSRLLECIRHVNQGIRLYQASISDLFGNNTQTPHKEDSPFEPSSHAAAKLYGYWVTRIYRETYNLFYDTEDYPKFPKPVLRARPRWSTAAASTTSAPQHVLPPLLWQ
jgi:hypothetical protein